MDNEHTCYIWFNAFGQREPICVCFLQPYVCKVSLKQKRIIHIPAKHSTYSSAGFRPGNFLLWRSKQASTEALELEFQHSHQLMWLITNAKNWLRLVHKYNTCKGKIEPHTVGNSCWSQNRDFPPAHQYWSPFPPFPYGLWLVIRGNESTVQKAYIMTGHMHQGIKDRYFINIPGALRF